MKLKIYTRDFYVTDIGTGGKYASNHGAVWYV